MRRFLILIVLSGACGPAAHAGIIQYTDRPTWQGAAGPLSGTENFNGFAADAQFRTAAVRANNMTIVGSTSVNGDQTNKIDAAPFEFNGNFSINSTAYLIGELVNSATITISFAQAVSAWGADFNGIGDGGRATRMDLFNTASVLIGSISFATTDTDIHKLQFDGFTTTGGDLVSRAVLINTDSPTAAVSNDVFGIDNIGFAGASVVPEPASLALLAGALLVGGAGHRLWGRRRADGRPA